MPLTVAEKSEYAVLNYLPPNYQTVVDAYALMGRPNMPPDDPGVQGWADANAQPETIWQTAVQYFTGDATWGGVAANAKTILDNIDAGTMSVQIDPLTGHVTLQQAAHEQTQQVPVAPVTTEGGGVPVAPPVTVPNYTVPGTSIALPAIPGAASDTMTSVSNAISSLTPTQKAFLLGAVVLLILRR